MLPDFLGVVILFWLKGVTLCGLELLSRIGSGWPIFWQMVSSSVLLLEFRLPWLSLSFGEDFLAGELRIGLEAAVFWFFKSFLVVPKGGNAVCFGTPISSSIFLVVVTFLLVFLFLMVIVEILANTGLWLGCVVPEGPEGVLGTVFGLLAVAVRFLFCPLVGEIRLAAALLAPAR